MKKNLKVLLAVLTAALLAVGGALAEEGDPAPMPAGAEAFEGVWQCDRASIEMYWEEMGFKVTVQHAGSAWEEYQWDYSCSWDEDSKTLVSLPFGLLTKFVYNDDGDVVSSEEIYSDGEASFSLDGEGCLIWKDEKENAGEGMRFVKMPAEEPLFATVGEAMDIDGYCGMSGEYGDKYVVITEKDGKSYRVVALKDETAEALSAAVFGAEDIEGAMDALAGYAKQLPVAYTEEITAVPLDREALDALVGKTFADLEAEGFGISCHGDEGGSVEFIMTRGMYDYAFTVSESVETYRACGEDGNYGGLTVKTADLAGFSCNALDLDYNADGTYTGASFGFDLFSGAFSGDETDLMRVLADAVRESGMDPDDLFAQLTEVMPGMEDQIRPLIEALKDLLGESAE